MAAATSTHLLFKSNSICTTYPLLMLCRRHCSTTISAAVRLVNHHKNNSSVRIKPIAFSVFGPKKIGLGEAESIRRTSQLCYCTEAQSNLSTAIKPEDENTDNEESKIREVANTLDIRVGRIIKAWRHEEADSLYVEEVDVGEPEPRTICSGLVKYIPIEHLQDRNVIVLANLKPRNMRGVKSCGMLMAASDASHENVELLVPPEGVVPGDRVWFGSPDDKENLPDAASPNQVQKKKTWELVQPHLKTDESCAASLGGTHTMRTSAGVITCDSLKNANIS